MAAYITRRLLGMIPTLVLVSILTFVIIQLPQGDYATALAAQAAASGGTGDDAPPPLIQDPTSSGSTPPR